MTVELLSYITEVPTWTKSTSPENDSKSQDQFQSHRSLHFSHDRNIFLKLLESELIEHQFMNRKTFSRSSRWMHNYLCFSFEK